MNYDVIGVVKIYYTQEDGNMRNIARRPDGSQLPPVNIFQWKQVMGTSFHSIRAKC